MLNNILLKIFNIRSILVVKLSSYFNKWYFKAKGAIIGKGFNVIGRVNIAGQGKITIGANFMMTSGEHINPISSNLQASILIDTTDSELHIGDNVGMTSTRIWVHDKLTIGNNVHIGAGVLLIDTDTHQIDYRLRRDPQDLIFDGLSFDEIWINKEKGTKSAPIIIEDDVWIGAQCIILKGVTIGARSIIGAGSVVSKSVPADCIAAGNPCRIIRKLV